MHVKCSRTTCLHEWEYMGESKHKATCPMCRKIVSIDEQIKKGGKQDV